MIQLKRVKVYTVEVTAKELFRNASKLAKNGFNKETVSDEIIDFVLENRLAIFGNDKPYSVVFNGYHEFLEVRQGEKSFNESLSRVIRDHDA